MVDGVKIEYFWFDIMNDTPEHIKQKQLEIWLAKTPAERIRQFCIDNDMLFQFWRQAGNPHLQEIPKPVQKVEGVSKV